MPELTTHLVAICPSNEAWSTFIPATEEGRHYLVEYGLLFGKQRKVQGVERGYVCSCPRFEFRSDCEHVQAARSLRCGWNEGMDVDLQPNRTTPTRPTCPRCGATIIWLEVAV